MRPLPAPESVPDARKLRRLCQFAPGQGAELVTIGDRAQRILNRCYAPLGPSPRAFQELGGFVDSCRRRDARERLYRAIFWQLAAKEVARGRLRMVGQ